MTETLDPMAATEVDQKQLAEQLLAQAKEQGVELMGPNGLLNQLTKNVLETALDAEMTEHLGYEKHDAAGRGSGNSGAFRHAANFSASRVECAALRHVRQQHITHCGPGCYGSQR